ncbi:MAG: lipopolysaccharide biosynthesis protein [Bryobacteraceae bacterium]
MTRTRRFWGGLRLSYLYQAVTLAAGLWLTPFLLKHLGQHDYGLWLVGLQTLSYLVLMDFGVIAILPRETAYATGHAISGNAGHDLSELIGRTARVVLYQTPLVAIAVAAMWFVVPAPPAIRGPILVAMVGFVVLFPLRMFQAVLHGLQETPYLGKLQFVSWGISTGLMVVFVWRGIGLYALAIGWALGQVLPAAFSFYRLKTAFPGVLPSKLPKLTRTELMRAMTSGSWISLSQVAQMLVVGTDFIIIGRFLGAAAVVPYACTQKLINVLANQPHLIMEMAMPGLSQMKTSENRDRIFRVCNALALSMLTASGAVVCVYVAVNHSFVTWWIGESQFGGQMLTFALAASLLLRQWNTTSIYTIFALGYERRISITTLVEGLVNLAAALILVRWLGPIGAPLGTILGVCLISIPGNLSALAHELGMSMFRVAAPLWSWFWRFVLVAGCAGAASLRWRPNLPYIVATTAVIGALYLVVMLPMIMDSHLKDYLPARAIRLWELFLRRFNWSPVAAIGQPAEAPKNS